MVMIEVDFEVFKALTIRRRSEEMTENDVIRELLGMPSRYADGARNHRDSYAAREKPRDNKKWPQGDRGQPSHRPWFVKGVTFPHGTRFRAHHHGQLYEATVEDGALVYGERRYFSPSAAARAITGYQTNGWRFWECKLPGSHQWTPIAKFRQ